jgi:hypothetical protein
MEPKSAGDAERAKFTAREEAVDGQVRNVEQRRDFSQSE